ncbi:MAG TPA: sigma-70 family RNA polymerase sigma factor [Burkholderiaceae bacterium]|nr:sigma-70 family RNA polymerase sigma factor [Burkholderiaceae bacterium]
MRIPTDLDDNECVARAQRGDRHAFSALVARYQDRVYRFLVRLTHSPDDALDLTQETFLRAYQHIARWRPEAQFKTWLFQIARNMAFDRLRRDKRVEFVELDEEVERETPDTAAGPDAALETAQRYRLLESALARLPSEHREILLLREIEEMSYDEIATVLGLNAGTVKSRIARARAALLARIPGRPEKSP